MADNKSKMADKRGNKMASKMVDDAGCKMASESGDDKSESVTLVTPPDGGYGWVIVFAAFVCNMITDGTAFSFGVLYDDLLDHFNDTKSKTSWIGSIFMGVPLLASPIASALINKYGCRPVSIVGGFMSTAGFVLSYFANSIEVLCLTFGLVSGVGLSMVYTPAVVIVAFYFEKRRALATGLSVAGSGIGTLAFAPLVEYLTDTYGWRGTILILAGLMLNTCVFGALYRPLVEPDHEKEEREERRKEVETVVVFDSATCSSQIAKIRELYSDSYSHSLIQFPTYLAKENDLSDRHHDDQSHKRRETVSMVTASTSLEKLHRSGSDGQVNGDTAHPFLDTHLSNRECNHGNDENHHGNHENDLLVLKNGTNHLTRNTSVDENHLSNQVNHHSNGAEINGKPRSHTIPSEYSRSSGTDRLHPLYRRDIFYKGSLLWIPQGGNPSRVHSCPDLYMRAGAPDDTETQCCQWKHVKRVVCEMLDISIFRQPLYLLFFISNFLLYMWYDIPYFYLPNSAGSNGLSEDAASWIISVIGIGNTIGQVAFGVIADLPQFNNSFVYGFGIFMCGVSILFIPLCSNMAALSTVGCLFGMFIGANYALCSIIIVDLLSLEKLTNAYGIVLCGQGVANLIGPPLGGLISDITHSYTATYLCAGSFIALSGVIMLAVALYQSKKPHSLQPMNDVLKPLKA